MTPLFVETQSSQPVESLSATDDMDRGQLRATQDAVQFTPTQAEGGCITLFGYHL